MKALRASINLFSLCNLIFLIIYFKLSDLFSAFFYSIIDFKYCTSDRQKWTISKCVSNILSFIVTLWVIYSEIFYLYYIFVIGDIFILE